MNSSIRVWFMAISMIWFSACHKNRESKAIKKATSDSAFLSKTASKKDSNTPVKLVPPVKVQEVVFNYLTAKSKFSFQGRNQSFDNTNVNIRMKKDSLIWISVTGVGFEVARGIITPDSIVFMDKIHKDYFVFSYAQLSKQYNFNLNFPILQSIIIGNMPFPQQQDAQFEKQDKFFILKQKQDRISIENFIGDDNLKLTRLNAVEAGTNNTFLLDYQDFKDINGLLFPFSSLVKLNVKSPKDQKISETAVMLKHSKVELVSQSPGFPFSIPASYSRKK